MKLSLTRFGKSMEKGGKINGSRTSDVDIGAIAAAQGF
ncbi:hypothetical protein ES705_36285 [subsurface metagenome]